MKNYIYNFLMAFLLLSLASCDEEFRGQYPVDNTAPKPVTVTRVINLPGAVLIDYEIPDETDILYIQAEYTLTDGEVRLQKAQYLTTAC